jgi:superoxide dismutase, Cu-Zn family
MALAPAGADQDITRAVAVIHPTASHDQVRGLVEFEQVEDGILIVAEIHGLEPNQKHGFHIHQWGDCSDPEAERAGGHFDPTDAPHGGPEDAKRHVGDLGNIEADDAGVGRYRRTDSKLTFTGENSIIGRAVVVHQEEDDLETQPTGDAGPRLGCGTIGMAEPPE